LESLDEDSGATTRKNISLTDPSARWTAAPGGPAFYAYSTNYLIDVDAGIIVDVEATPAPRSDEVHATQTPPTPSGLSWQAGHMIGVAAKLSEQAGTKLSKTISPAYAESIEIRNFLGFPPLFTDSSGATLEYPFSKGEGNATRIQTFLARAWLPGSPCPDSFGTRHGPDLHYD
jgi:hypothetical protein